MVSRTRLEKRFALRARQLAKRTFRAFCFCVLAFLAITIAVIVFNPGSVQREDDVSISMLMVLGIGKLILPVTVLHKDTATPPNNDDLATRDAANPSGASRPAAR
jgi:hypothetical protein